MSAEFLLGWEQRIYVILTVVFPQPVFFSLKITKSTHLFSSNFSIQPNDV